nr:PREDICTED: uncharacterized protein LOC109031852 isoform X2 [Bemisia tabaci]XP_018899190.1 PREDICTED: uncharacterized protein LOC109031852 isoform X2 [Bemisia tabaci]XP_018899191.1 PREDICTED: uncharacterized protein LOC109031852 isoform X2 [Bemisia tabaci]XP_018899192.1 PREDICTED: uncharacterized protein LOC109031852 isoform X2 [Bemisia tabaci]
MRRNVFPTEVALLVSMLHRKIVLSVGSIWTVASLIHLIDGGVGGSGDDDYEDEDRHNSLNLLLNVNRNTKSTRKLQCRSADKSHHRRGDSKNQLMNLLGDPEKLTNDKKKREDESHTEMCYRNEKEEENLEFDENPPTRDPNLLPPSVPEMEIKGNNSILVSWRAVVREKYPIDYFFVEYYQYNRCEFCSKCCTWVNNEPKNKSSNESYHEELINILEPNFDYKFRIYIIYWNEEIIPGEFCEPIKLVWPI